MCPRLAPPLLRRAIFHLGPGSAVTIGCDLVVFVFVDPKLILVRSLICIANAILPTVSNHADTLGFGHPVELRGFFEVLLATDALGIAKACFCQCV